jgi:hypothetical protein
MDSPRRGAAAKLGAARDAPARHGRSWPVLFLLNLARSRLPHAGAQGRDGRAAIKQCPPRVVEAFGRFVSGRSDPSR